MSKLASTCRTRFCTVGPLLAVVALATAAMAATPEQGVVSTTVSVGDYSIMDTAAGQRISAEGLGQLLIPGRPVLPAKIFSVAIPPGAEVTGVTFDTSPGVVLPGRYDIAPAPLPRVIGHEDPAVYATEQQRYQANHDAVYGADDVYPQNVAEFVRSAGYRKYNLADVRVTPFSYRPLSGQLTQYARVTVHVHYEVTDPQRAVIVDDLPRTEEVARGIIANYDQATNWYPKTRFTGRGLHDFVIITIDSLVPVVSPLVTWETTKGRTVEVVTTTWINSNYTGYDLAARMRAFLRDKYPAGQWGIEDVLLVGDYSDVPMRRVAQNVGYGQPETDLYYAELSLPDGQSWDADGDHQFCEDSDPIDFYNEVNVGRIPWSNATTVSNICAKTVAYEQNNDPGYKKNVLLLGGYFWSDTDNAVLMETKINQPWMSDWTFTRMYEQNSGYWSTYPCDYPLLQSNVLAVWPAGQYAFVNWAGHGSPTSCHIYGLGAPAFIESTDCPLLSDDYPAIIFADACSNSDTDHVNIGKAMLQQGAVGFVGSTKVAMGCPGWSAPMDGSSQSLDYMFTTCVTSGDYTQGQALQYGLREMYTNGMWNYARYEACEWGALWGNPNLGMSPPAELTIRLPNGAPEVITPGEPTSVNVTISDGLQNYVPGTGLLHYRYDGGDFVTVPLTLLFGDLYEAVLPPAGCSATPEFYMSATGDGGTTVVTPFGAPAMVYTATVGTFTTVFADDFETGQGWLSQIIGASAGFWQRGIPVNDPNWDYDPYSDSDGSGKCYLTQNELGNSDVDDGAVRLVSPTMDMSAGNITISYDYFLRLTNNPGDVDAILVEIDSNGGIGPWTEIARHANDGGLSWRHHSIDQATLDALGVVLTPTMVLRFTTNDADPQSINESGLDAVEVTSFSCTTPFVRGDLNCDGAVDFDDINPFVLALSGEEGYSAQYPTCIWLNADCDEDGDVDFDDINPFVTLLGS